MEPGKELGLKEMETVSGGAGEDKRYIIYTVVKGDTLPKIRDSGRPGPLEPYRRP